MAVARLVAAPFPLAAARVRGPPARLPFAPLSARPLSRRAAAPALRVASDGNGGLVPGRPDQEAEDVVTALARGAVSERAARKESERRTYLVAALMSSLGITSMAAAAVYYRFAWQMEVPMVTIPLIPLPNFACFLSRPFTLLSPPGRRDSGDGNAGHLRTLRGRGGEH